MLQYLEMLDRFGLHRLTKGDLRLDGNGNWSVTRDGDFQFGDTATNAMFRFAQRWRPEQPALDELLRSMLSTTQLLDELRSARDSGIGPSLSINPEAFHSDTESMGNYESGSAVYAGAICVVLNNLLLRFRKDLGLKKSDPLWRDTGPKTAGHSMGVVFQAAAENFRHYDEWAGTRVPTDQQRESMEVLCAVLRLPLMTSDIRTIRTNVCRGVLLAVRDGSSDKLHHSLFDYAKALCRW
jgi:hypothetical protein